MSKEGVRGKKEMRENQCPKRERGGKKERRES